MTADQDAMQKRYHNGYTAGHAVGYKTGYREGYQAGYKAALEKVDFAVIGLAADPSLPGEAVRSHRRAIGRAS